MKLYTHASPSHESLLQEFLLPSAVEFDEVVVGRCSQVSDDQYGLPGWGENTYEKARTMRRAVYECENLVVWADADVMFLAPAAERLVAELDENDIAFQRDHRQFCTGVWIARCNGRVRQLFDEILCMRERFKNQGFDDQTAMNRVVHQFDVKASFLPTSKFCTAGYQDGRWREWNPSADRPPVVPPTAIVFHANWCRGLEAKRLILQQVRAMCAARSRQADEECRA
ncbi:MAG: putative nucleotide-diphospho-sugar transferase [Pirellulaceae bacterium]